MQTLSTTENIFGCNRFTLSQNFLTLLVIGIEFEIRHIVSKALFCLNNYKNGSGTASDDNPLQPIHTNH